MPAVKIVSTGAHLPGAPIANAEIERLAGPLPEEILEGIQVQTRHWLVDPATGEHNEANSDMAAAAARQALARAGVDADEVELLIVSTASPDFPLPPMATLVQDRLGLERCTALELRSGCAGAVEALDIARSYIERGTYRTALVIGSEAISPLLVPVYRGQDPDRIRMRDRIGLYTFGDGAGAILLRAAEPGETAGVVSHGWTTHGGIPAGVLAASSRCIGGGRRPGMEIVGAGTHAPVHRQLEAKRLVDLRIDVVESARFTPTVIAEALEDLLGRARLRATDIASCILPEGNAGYLTDELEAAGAPTADWEGLADRVIENLASVGATGSAAVPLALDDAWQSGKLTPGDLVMLLAIETSKWKYSGMILPWTAPAPEGSVAAVVADPQSELAVAV
jgi:3-oxoacyl-[acyl-carrier-protein] synthase-3